MPLNDTAIRNIKPKDRPFKLADGNGLYLFVTATGSRLWRLKYRFGGDERTLSIGAYPAVTIKPDLNSKRWNGACNLLILLIWGSDFSKTWCHVCLLFRLVHG